MTAIRAAAAASKTGAECLLWAVCDELTALSMDTARDREENYARLFAEASIGFDIRGIATNR